MSEIISVKNNIQKYILTKLCHQKYMHFVGLRPPKISTNHLSYHLKVLEKNKFIEKRKEGYTLGSHGMRCADGQGLQPKIISMLVIQNSNGDVLLWRRNKQPYIDTWTLPYGKVHIGDTTIQAAAARVASEKLGIKITPDHAGDCYIRVMSDDDIMSSTSAHVFRYEADDIAENEHIQWARPHKLSQYDLAPAVEQIVARTFFRDPYFFEEFNVAW